MAGIANDLEIKILNKVFRDTDFSVEEVWVKLHIGDPGEDADQNAAGEATRIQATFDVVVTDGDDNTIANDAVIEWEDVAATEEYTHVSLWDDETTGDPLWKGPLTQSRAVLAGDTFRIPVGDLIISLD